MESLAYVAITGLTPTVIGTLLFLVFVTEVSDPMVIRGLPAPTAEPPGIRGMRGGDNCRA